MTAGQLEFSSISPHQAFQVFKSHYFLSYPLDPPTKGVLKLNFDGVSKGNPGNFGFGGVIQNHKGEILLIYHGNIGHNSDNATKLEGLW